MLNRNVDLRSMLHIIQDFVEQVKNPACIVSLAAFTGGKKGFSVPKKQV